METFNVSHYNRFHPSPQHFPPIHDIPPRSIAFHSAKEGSTLFPRNQQASISSHYTPLQSIPQLSTSFATIHNVLLGSIPTKMARFPSTKLRTVYWITSNAIPVHSPRFYYIPQNSTTIHCIPFCFKKLHSFPNWWGTVDGVTLHTIPVHVTRLYSIPEDLTVFCGIPFSQRELHLCRDHSGTLSCVTLHTLLH